MKHLALPPLFLALLLIVPVSVAQVPAEPIATHAEDIAEADIVSALEARGTFTVLVGALRDTGLADALASGETFTLFAPTDAAFATLPDGMLKSLTPEQLASVLRYHLVVGEVSSSDAAALASAPTVQGSPLAITATGDALTVDGAVVTESDVEASNGVIHVIDAVLMPSGAAPDAEAMDEMEDDGSMEKEPMESEEPAHLIKHDSHTDDQR